MNMGMVGEGRRPAFSSAQAGRLDVLALLTVHGQTAYWAAQVLPPS
jgi:hypothetical protein